MLGRTRNTLREMEQQARERAEELREAERRISAAVSVGTAGYEGTSSYSPWQEYIVSGGSVLPPQQEAELISQQLIANSLSRASTATLTTKQAKVQEIINQGPEVARMLLNREVKMLYFGKTKNPIGKIVGLASHPVQPVRIIFEFEQFTFDRYFSVKEFEVMGTIGKFDLKDMVYRNLIAFIERDKNSVYEEAHNYLNNVTRDLQATEENRERILEALKEAQERIKGTEKVKYHKKDIDLIIAEINSHKKVKKAYISKSGRIIVLTEPLYKTDVKGKESKRSKIGEFIFSIEPQSNNYLSADNLTYIYDDSNPHPNIDGFSVCWGENQQEIDRMRRNAEYYQLVDFAIYFLSIYPQTSDASPYVDYGDWWSEKEERVDYKSELEGEAL